MQRAYIYTIALVFLFLLNGCSKEFEKTPVDNLVLEMNEEEDFTLILLDMKQEGSFSPDFFHKYKVIKPAGSEKPEVTETEWMPVSERFFDLHINDMGMEIAAKTDGVVTRDVSPPGYSNYVGNDKYGKWETRSDGTSFWAFYGQFVFMQSMLGLMGGPVYRNHYTDYRSNYRGTGRGYYGPMAGGSRQYGTFSSANRAANPSSFNRLNSNNSFKSRVNSRVSRSGSRYGGSSSGRSRSFGGGK